MLFAYTVHTVDRVRRIRCYFVFLQTLIFKSFESSWPHNSNNLRASGIYNSLSSSGLPGYTLSAMQNHLCCYFAKQLHRDCGREGLQMAQSLHQGDAHFAARWTGKEQELHMHLWHRPLVHVVKSKVSPFYHKRGQVLRYAWNLLKCDLTNLKCKVIMLSWFGFDS